MSPEPSPSWYHEQNGFSSRRDMDRAHAPLVALARPLVGREPTRVLDLGCGNGVLLGRLREVSAAVTPFGVDCQAERVERARELFPDFTRHFACASMFDVEAYWPEDQRIDLVLLMPGRFLEVPRGDGAALRRRLGERATHLLLYAYSDWLARFGDLASIGRAAGFEVLGGGPAAWGRLAPIPEDHP